MTAVLDAPADLTDYEFSIACEWPRCNEPASNMVKGCSSKRHFAMCDHHVALRREWFATVQGNTICDGCNRPFIFFENHYDLVGI